MVELEWPARLRLGESDVLRLALVPAEGGYTAQAEFPEHTLATQSVPVQRPPGYSLSAVARLDGVGFDISPTGDQLRLVPPGEVVSWRWSLAPRAPGRQRLSIVLLLRWEPDPGLSAPRRESSVYGRSLDVQVISFLGLRRPEAMAFGLVGLVAGSGLSFWALFARRRQPGGAGWSLRRGEPNPRVALETGAGMSLNGEETHLLQALFGRYARLVLEREFLSGYSGARTFLARPVREGGHADAETIVKIGPREDIRAEYENYETFVKDRLPPVTARIQHNPVTLKKGERAALQYTCIAEPGKPPRSLRQALLERPDPTLIRRLFDTFGPNWWMQRQPYAFRLAQEYDRLLPPHLVLSPMRGAVRATVRLEPMTNPSDLGLRAGDQVTLPAFQRAERRRDGRSQTLYGSPFAGQAPLRLRWLSLDPPEGAVGQVVATRRDLLAEATAGLDLFGLPDPLLRLDAWLQEPLMGTRSTIHGDLNLENVLVGPGNLVWLIDFAQTRLGHPLYDFAHLASELVAHVLCIRAGDHPRAYLDVLQGGQDPLLDAVEAVACNCLFDPKVLREYHLALIMACLGALKYPNLTQPARHCLYLTAAWVGGIVDS